VTRADLAGTPWIADFVFTRCAIYCPRLTVRMKELRERLPPAIRTVSFSVDPEHDTPEVLERYAEQWGIEGRSWLFLTGEREPMWRLVREGFLLPVEDAPEVEASPILHSNRFVLVDSAGRIRDTYDAFDDDALERILADLSALAAEEGG
jgi:protein SCO1/2